jgi:epsilon-lactone hydrolase
VHVGNWERLRDDSIVLAERMKVAKVRVELKIFDGMRHGWRLFAPMLEDGMASIEQAARFVQAEEASK